MSRLPDNLLQAMAAATAGAAPRGKRKYRNEVTEVDGVRFDSRAEAKRWSDLLWLQRAGEISDLQRQVKYELIPAQVTPSGLKVRSTFYVADFVYRDKNNEIVVEDPKGFSTPEWKLKRKLMLHVHGIWVREIRQ